MSSANNPYSQHDPKYSLAPNPSFYLYEMKIHGQNYRSIKKHWDVNFNHTFDDKVLFSLPLGPPIAQICSIGIAA